MALLFCDGFDHLNIFDFAKKWDSYASNNWFLDRSIKRFGSGSARYNRASNGDCVWPLTKSFYNSYQTMIVGHGLRMESISGDSPFGVYWRFWDGSTLHVDVRMNTDLTIGIYRNTTLLATTPAFCALGAWNFIEIKVVIDDTAGSVTIRKNGAAFYELTGVDTRNGGNAGVNKFQQGGWGYSYNGNGENYNIDDLYIESANFLGDIRVDTLYPSGAGANSDWTVPAITGATGYQYSLSWGTEGMGSSIGWRFKALKAITVTALKVMSCYSSQTQKLNLWDTTTNSIIATATVTGTAGSWITGVLGSPVTLVAGREYVLSMNRQSGGDGYYRWGDPTAATVQQYVAQNYITFIGAYRDGAVDGIPPNLCNKAPAVDIIFDYAPTNVEAAGDELLDNNLAYIASQTVGQKETFAFSNMATTAGTIKGVQVNLLARKDNAGSRQIAPIVRPGSVDNIGNTIDLGDTYMDWTQIYETNPDTSNPWTIAEVNAAEFGVKVIS